jgi:hypothetical protein
VKGKQVKRVSNVKEREDYDDRSKSEEVGKVQKADDDTGEFILFESWGIVTK